MKTELVNGPTEAILENIRRANERKLRERTQAAIKAGKGSNPAEPRMVAMFLDMCHNGRRSK